MAANRVRDYLSPPMTPPRSGYPAGGRSRADRPDQALPLSEFDRLLDPLLREPYDPDGRFPSWMGLPEAAD